MTKEKIKKIKEKMDKNKARNVSFKDGQGSAIVADWE